jgi:hypothetical protein
VRPTSRPVRHRLTKKISYEKGANDGENYIMRNFLLFLEGVHEEKHDGHDQGNKNGVLLFGTSLKECICETKT